MCLLKILIRLSDYGQREYADRPESFAQHTYPKVSAVVPHMDFITKTCLYNFDPLKPHFYKVKLGFKGVFYIFLISTQNIDCGTR